MCTERRGRSSFDQLPAMDIDTDALDLDDARRRYAERGTELTDGLIRTFEIASEINGELVPTNGGLLLFGREPQKVHPDAVCLCARFRGTRKGTDILDQEEIRTGSVLTILDAMDAFIARNNPTASVVRGRQRDDIRHYDPLVIREALNNAIAHPDYSVDGARFHVHIFDDRLVIESRSYPLRLGGHWPQPPHHPPDSPRRDRCTPADRDEHRRWHLRSPPPRAA
jgi:ATP-dependent DNA helicase RecG